MNEKLVQATSKACESISDRERAVLEVLMRQDPSPWILSTLQVNPSTPLMSALALAACAEKSLHFIGAVNPDGDNPKRFYPYHLSKVTWHVTCSGYWAYEHPPPSGGTSKRPEVVRYLETAGIGK